MPESGPRLLLVLPGIGCADDDAVKTKDRPANRLAKETSPYLLLHAHNPVDWYPWGPEAFAKAKAENKPIFLSIGYSSCYWCHVMERESFMDAGIAEVLNENFVCIKVDREERPDVDQIYMAALQAAQRLGRLADVDVPDARRPPLLRRDLFPAARPRRVVRVSDARSTRVAEAWRKISARRSRHDADAADRRRCAAGSTARPVGRAVAARGHAVGRDERPSLAEQFDPEYGGFGFNPANPERPKFPEPVEPGLPARSAPPRRPRPRRGRCRRARDGPRSRSTNGPRRHPRPPRRRLPPLCTDRYWIVPHFEKMLYDNAQLASVHLAAFEITGDPRWRRRGRGDLRLRRANA